MSLAAPVIFFKTERCEQRLVNVRFGPAYGLKSYISRRPKTCTKPEVTGYHSIFVTESGNTMIACGLTVAGGSIGFVRSI